MEPILAIIGAFATIIAAAIEIYGRYRVKKHAPYEDVFNNIYKPLYELLWDSENIDLHEAKRIYDTAYELLIKNIHGVSIGMMRKLNNIRCELHSDSENWLRDYWKWRNDIIGGYWLVKMKLGLHIPNINSFDYRLSMFHKPFVAATITIYIATLILYTYQYVSDKEAFMKAQLPMVIQFINILSMVFFVLSLAFLLLGIIFIFLPPATHKGIKAAVQLGWRGFLEGIARLRFSRRKNKVSHKMQGQKRKNRK